MNTTQKKLRAMQTSDIDAVVTIIDSHDEDDAEEAQQGFRKIAGTEGYYVLEHHGKPIGVTGYSKPDGCDETYWLGWTYVDADHINQGHGRKIIQELIDMLKEMNARKLFVKVSDYVDPEDGAIYAAALHLYQSMGFANELTHADYYDEGESQHILGMRLKAETGTTPSNEYVSIQFNAVFEIAECDDAYSFGWHGDSDTMMTRNDVEIGIDSVRNDDGRAVFLSFPSNFSDIDAPLLDAGFKKSGILQNYYEDGVHDQHYTYHL